MSIKPGFFICVFLFFPVVLFSQVHDSLPPPDNISIQNASPAYVVFDVDTLFKLTSNFGAYTPAERARSINKRLEFIAENIIHVQDSFNIVELTNYSVISYKDKMIMSLSDEDTRQIGLTRQEAAMMYVDDIKLAFTDNLERRTLVDWLKRIGYTLLILFGLILIFYLINKLFKWINKKLVNYEKGLKRKRKSVFRYLAPKGPDYFFVFLSNIVRFVLIVLIIIIYLPLLFSFLPWTKHIVEQFYNYLASPIMYILYGLYGFLPNVIFIVIIVFIARYILRIVTYVSGEIEQERLKLKGFHKDWAH